MVEESKDVVIGRKHPVLTGIVIIALTLTSLGILWGSLRFAYIIMDINILGIPIEYYLFISFLLCWALIAVVASKSSKENCHIYRSEDGDKYIKKW